MWDSQEQIERANELTTHVELPAVLVVGLTELWSLCTENIVPVLAKHCQN